jgi:hypothetical protein
MLFLSSVTEKEITSNYVAFNSMEGNSFHCPMELMPEGQV